MNLSPESRLWRKKAEEDRDMEIQLKRGSTTPLYKQLRNNIRDQILSGQLADGFKLPSERQLVEKLQVHRNTIKKAYEMLIHEGLVYASVKSPGVTLSETAWRRLGRTTLLRPRGRSHPWTRTLITIFWDFKIPFSGCTIPPTSLTRSPSPGFSPTRRPFRWSISTKYSGKSLQREPRSRSGFVIPKARSG